MSNYPLFAEDFLIQGGAVFAGLVKRDLLRGHVASVSLSSILREETIADNLQWSLLYSSLGIPVTVFVDSCGVMVGYDYFSPGLRTRVRTEFFNTAVGPVQL